jgi:ribosomal subunit interface protein
MEIVVTARHTEVSGRFRRILDEKLAKVEQYAPRALRLEVGVSHELNKRQSHNCERIELTLHGKGPVVRAEACASDAQSALDLAVDKLVERLRRASDRRKLHRGGRHPMPSVRGGAGPEAASAPGAEAAPETVDSAPPVPAPLPVDDHDHAPSDPLAVPASGAASAADSDAPFARAEYPLGESPVLIRDKVHVARPMPLDDALNAMELVGHDFYLFIDATTGCPSVVYRRRGWSYGVIRLAGNEDEAAEVSRVLLAAASPQAEGGEDTSTQASVPTAAAGTDREPAQVG